jgi:hypothetical protein
MVITTPLNELNKFEMLLLAHFDISTDGFPRVDGSQPSSTAVSSEGRLEVVGL